MSELTIKTPDDSEVKVIYAEENDPRELGRMPAGIQARLDELAELIDRDTTITLARNWEGIAFGIVDDAGDSRFDVLTFMDDGHVGHGDVNQPKYFASIRELCAAEDQAC